LGKQRQHLSVSRTQLLAQYLADGQFHYLFLSPLEEVLYSIDRARFVSDRRFVLGRFVLHHGVPAQALPLLQQ
jgi:hypothetical protein